MNLSRPEVDDISNLPDLLEECEYSESDGEEEYNSPDFNLVTKDIEGL